VVYGRVYNRIVDSCFFKGIDLVPILAEEEEQFLSE
jgi:hypothetical protein